MRTRILLSALAAVAALAVTGCEGTRSAGPTPSDSAPPSPVTVTETAWPSSELASGSGGTCGSAPAYFSGGMVPVHPGDGIYAHLDDSPRETNHDTCAVGLTYAVLAGVNGDATGPAGTGSALFESLVIYADGRPADVITPFEFREIIVLSATSSQIVVNVDLRDSGVEPQKLHTITFGYQNGRVTTRPHWEDLRQGDSGVPRPFLVLNGE